MSNPAIGDPVAKKSKDLSTAIQKWAAIILGVGVIIGIPVLITVGVKLYDIQEARLQAQIKANEAQIKAVEAQNEVLKQTQYSEAALNELKSQRELFDRERKSLSTQLTDAKTQLAQAKNDAITEANQSLSKLRKEADQALEAHLAEVESALKALSR
jgi:chromosome segregation ATPase